MAAPTRIPERQLDLGSASYFRTTTETPPGNQTVVRKGFTIAGGYKVADAFSGGDQTTAAFAPVGVGQQRYDLVYLDQSGAAQIRQGTSVASGSPAYNGAPGFSGGPDLPDPGLPISYVFVNETAAVTVDVADITNLGGQFQVPRDFEGYWIDKGLFGSPPTGSTSIVTANFSGESSAGTTSAPFARGIVTVAPDNVQHLLDQKRDEIVHAATGSRIYGRITFLAGVWTLTYYYTDVSGVEQVVGNIATDTTLGVGGLTDVRLVGAPKVFSRNDPVRPMFPSSSITDQVAGIGVSVPRGGVIEWQPPTSATAPSVPPLPTGFEYCDGTAVTTPGSPYLPANMPGFLKPNRMKTPSGGASRFARGADYSTGSHGAAFAEPTGGTDIIPSAGGSTPFSGSISGSTGNTDISHTHSIGSDGGHNHDYDAGTNTGHFVTVGSQTGQRTDVSGSHNHGGGTGGMSGSNPHGHSFSAPFSGSINTAHDHGGENRPAFSNLAFIMRVL